MKSITSIIQNESAIFSYIRLKKSRMNTPDAAPFLIDRNFQFFTPVDIIASLLGIILIYIFLYTRKQRYKDQPYYRFYVSGFSFKLFFMLANAAFYIIVYKGGGDSIGYWDGAVKLNNLFWKNPELYFRELFTSDEIRTVYRNFDLSTGYPDGRIYAEQESFFISKLASIFTFFTFKGYILISIFFAWISHNASWKLFELVRSYQKHTDSQLAIALFFIPSLSFWCSGISKDTVIWIALCYFLYHLYQIITPEKKSGLLNWISIIISLYVFYRVRSFMLATIFIPLLFAWGASKIRSMEGRKFEQNAIRALVTFIGIAGIVIFMQTSVSDRFVEEASIINQDMTNNQTYGKNRYDLGITEYNLSGILKAAPAAIIAGIYRPFIWESLSISLIMDGLESVILIILTFLFFFNGKIFSRIRRVNNHEFLVFSLFFVLILAYFAGFTSILFGVLVRFKAPLLPFVVILLTSYYQDEHKQANPNE